MPGYLQHEIGGQDRITKPQTLQQVQSAMQPAKDMQRSPVVFFRTLC